MIYCQAEKWHKYIILESCPIMGVIFSSLSIHSILNFHEWQGTLHKWSYNYIQENNSQTLTWIIKGVVITIPFSWRKRRFSSKWAWPKSWWLVSVVFYSLKLKHNTNLPLFDTLQSIYILDLDLVVPSDGLVMRCKYFFFFLIYWFIHMIMYTYEEFNVL